MVSEELEASVAKLQSRLNPEVLKFETTADVPLIEGVFGQDRALRALEFGLRATNSGSHVYAAGPVGTGKMTAIQTVLARLKERRPTPPDWCYVHDFGDSDRPRALSLPAGRGQQLVEDMERLVEGARETIPRAFESEDYAQRKAPVLRKFEEEGERLHKEVAEDARRQGFAIEPNPVGFVAVPLIDGRPATKEEYHALPEKERLALQEKGEKIQQAVAQALRRTHGPTLELAQSAVRSAFPSMLASSAPSQITRTSGRSIELPLPGLSISPAGWPSISSDSLQGFWRSVA